MLCIFVCSAVNTSSVSLNNTISDNCVFLLLGFLIWTKNLAYSTFTDKFKNWFKDIEVFEKLEQDLRLYAEGSSSIGYVTIG